MTRRQRTHHHHAAVTVYTHWHELLANPTEPMPEAKRTRHLTRIYSGLAAIETATAPSTDDWRVCSDAVNLMESLIEMGVCQDETGLLDDAIAGLAGAGRRHRAGLPIRLDGPGIQAVRAVVEDYAAALEALPERTVIAAHRRTERRLQDILAGRRRSTDVEVMGL